MREGWQRLSLCCLLTPTPSPSPSPASPASNGAPYPPLLHPHARRLAPSTARLHAGRRPVARSLMPSLRARSSPRPPAPPVAAGAPPHSHSSRSQHGEYWHRDPHVLPAASGRGARQAVTRAAALLAVAASPVTRRPSPPSRCP